MDPRHKITDAPSRILIVDDELHNRQLLEVMLAPEGFRLLSVSSGEEALAIVAQRTARPHPARHHDAGDGRLRGDRQDQGQPLWQEHPRHLDHRPRRSPVQDARAQGRRRGFSHQARRSVRTVRPGEKPGAPQGVRRPLRPLQPCARRRSGLEHRQAGGKRGALPPARQRHPAGLFPDRSPHDADVLCESRIRGRVRAQLRQPLCQSSILGRGRAPG